MLESCSCCLRHSRYNLTVTKLCLGLTLELRLCNLYRNHSCKTFTEVICRKIELKLSKHTLLVSIVLEGSGKTHLETLKVGTTLDGVDIVYV